MRFTNFNILKIFYLIIFSLTSIFLVKYISYVIYLNPLFYSSQLISLNINFLGISLFISGVIVGLMVFWLSDVRIFFNKVLSILLFFLFLILIILFIVEKSYINLFILYELFLLPSFYLVYYLSPNRRSIPIAVYFLTWTQFGSLLVLVAIIYIYYNIKTMYLIQSPNLNFTFLSILLFIGFGIKIPVWPFYYWLTKTHVEASSFFSIYLSGFLVKTAVFLLSHFYAILFNVNLLNCFFVVLVIGIIDSSFKMWSQIDLKKLIAYTTVQEMNILCIPLALNSSYSEFILGLFIITHCVLSSLFFFIIDCLIKRFNTRSSIKLTGLVHITPIFGIFLFISIIFFSGLPFTAKFLCEIVIFNNLLIFNSNIFLLIFISANFIGLIGFSKNFFNILFGNSIINNIVYDLTKKEIFIFIFLLNLLIFISYLSFIL